MPSRVPLGRTLVRLVETVDRADRPRRPWPTSTRQGAGLGEPGLLVTPDSAQHKVMALAERAADVHETRGFLVRLFCHRCGAFVTNGHWVSPRDGVGSWGARSSSG